MPTRLRHERCGVCADDLARWPEMPCDRCGTRYHSECLLGSGCTRPACRDPLLEAMRSLPAVIAERLPAHLAPKASCVRRMAAFVLDSGVALSASIACAVPAMALGLTEPHVRFVAVLGIFISAFLNEVVLTGTQGASLGKRAMGIRVTTRDGQNPGVLRAFLREVPGKFCSQAPWMLGFAMAAVDPDTRALHDRLAGTWVVEE